MLSICSGRESVPVDPFIALRAEIGKRAPDANRAGKMEAHFELESRATADDWTMLTKEEHKSLGQEGRRRLFLGRDLI